MLDNVSRKVGESGYTHQLSHYLQEYDEMRDNIVLLQEEYLDGNGWKEPSHEQMKNIFDNLNHVENEINEMEQFVEIYLTNASRK